MRQVFDTMSEYGGRKEYQQNHDGKELEECNEVTNLINDLLLMQGERGSDVPPTTVSDDKGVLISRSYKYIEADRPYGWAWPLVEKSIDITYSNSKNGLSCETYRIAVGTTVHQIGATENPILSVYTINYFGKDRCAVYTSIESQDIINENDGMIVERAMVDYDRAVVYGELCSLMNMYDVQAEENKNIQ